MIKVQKPSLLGASFIGDDLTYYIQTSLRLPNSPIAYFGHDCTGLLSQGKPGHA